MFTNTSDSFITACKLGDSSRLELATIENFGLNTDPTLFSVYRARILAGDINSHTLFQAAGSSDRLSELLGITVIIRKNT